MGTPLDVVDDESRYRCRTSALWVRHARAGCRVGRRPAVASRSRLVCATRQGRAASRARPHRSQRVGQHRDPPIDPVVEDLEGGWIGEVARLKILTTSGEPTAVQLASEPGIGDAVRISAGIDSAVASCDVVGGTAPERVAAALAATGARLEGAAAEAGDSN
jgi:hypothetical protein